ncbi:MULTISPECIES: hypothetical protein [Hyphobacterium]|uniref:Antibiotic biosynthesis monooxygenase n=1 Tax=Hyphobacterium vulgare TaxID=1736751 RepID=A0ABV6ZX44_9PROT
MPDAYAITFRFKSDSTYSERLESLEELIKAESPGKWWRETTSFYLFRSSKSAADLISHFYLKSKFDATKDIMGVINLSRKDHAHKGTFTDADWESILSNR